MRHTVRGDEGPFKLRSATSGHSSLTYGKVGSGEVSKQSRLLGLFVLLAATALGLAACGGR